MSALSSAQRQALRWIATFETIPPVEPRTWKSLISRGLVVLPVGAPPYLTAEGLAAL